MLTSFLLLPHFFLPLHLWVLCFSHFLPSGTTGLALSSGSVLLFHEAVPWDFLFLYSLYFTSLFFYPPPFSFPSPLLGYIKFNLM